VTVSEFCASTSSKPVKVQSGDNPWLEAREGRSVIGVPPPIFRSNLRLRGAPLKINFLWGRRGVSDGPPVAAVTVTAATAAAAAVTAAAAAAAVIAAATAAATGQ